MSHGLQHEYLRRIREQQLRQYARPLKPQRPESRFVTGLALGVAISVPAWVALIWCVL